MTQYGGKKTGQTVCSGCEYRFLIMILTVYSRFFRLYMSTAIAPIPLARFAGQPSSSIGIAF